MRTDALPPDGPEADESTAPRGSTGGRGRLVAWLAALGSLAAIVAVAWALTGPSPARSGHADVPAPPIVLQDALASDQDLSVGSDLLAAGRLPEARRRFAAAARRSRAAPTSDRARAAAVGTALADWTQDGPDGVRRTLTSLADEPGLDDDGYVTLHLGVVDLLLGHRTRARRELATARGAALRARAFDVARRCDDLQHDALPPGYPPVVVDPGGLAGQDAADAVRLRELVVAGDRPDAATWAATVLARRPAAPAAVRAMALTARFDKDRPARDLAALAATARVGRLDLRLQLALVQLWGGRRSEATAGLRALASSRARSTSDRAVVAIARKVLAQG